MNLQEYLNSKGRGSTTALAKSIGAHVPDVSRWAEGKRPCPPWRCLKIEKYTNGVVSRKDLRPLDYKKHWPELEDDHDDN